MAAENERQRWSLMSVRCLFYCLFPLFIVVLCSRVVRVSRRRPLLPQTQYLPCGAALRPLRAPGGVGSGVDFVVVLLRATLSPTEQSE